MQLSNSFNKYRISRGSALITLLVALIVTLTACGENRAESVAQAAGTKILSVSEQLTTGDVVVIKVTLKEFQFEPDTLRIPAGKKIMLVLENEGAVAHEFMAGRDVKSDVSSFNEDLFAGVDVEMGMGMDMDMDHEAMEKMGDMDHEAMEKMGDMDHEAMEKMGDMKGEHEHAEEAKEHEHAEEAEEHEHGESAEEDDHAEEAGGHEHGAGDHGTMMLVQTASEGTMSFTLPQAKRGTWMIGCFLPGHFGAGMKAILIVE